MSIQRLSNAGQSGYRYKTLIAGITPVASVPVIGEATAVTYSTASVAFTAPGAYAGSTYTATSSPGGFTGTSASSPITVSGLSGETSYTFTVTATNATGTSGPSAASNSITTPAEWSPEGGYDSLAAVTLSTPASSITFSDIPTGYKHLQIRYISRGSISASFTNVNVRLNGDTGNNYITHWLDGDGSTAKGENSGTTNLIYLGVGTGSTANANVFGAGVFDLLDYASTNKNKTLRSLAGEDNNGSGFLGLISGLWVNTSAVTTIDIFPNSGTFNQYSSFALFGVK